VEENHSSDVEEAQVEEALEEELLKTAPEGGQGSGPAAAVEEAREEGDQAAKRAP